MSPLALLKATACLVVNSLASWISLAERRCSSFALVVSFVQVRSCFLFPVMPMRVISGRFKPMRVGHRNGIIRLRALIDDILF
jgi:Na+-transporting NADH:ubiquinone oxidoreductase subunit NqrB